MYVCTHIHSLHIHRHHGHSLSTLTTDGVKCVCVCVCVYQYGVFVPCASTLEHAYCDAASLHSTTSVYVRRFLHLGGYTEAYARLSRTEVFAFDVNECLV